MTGRRTDRHPRLARFLLLAAAVALAAAPADALAQKKGRNARGKAAAGKADKAAATRPGKRKAKPKRGGSKKRGKGKAQPRVKVFDFTGLDLAGRLRTPQLIYFLDRAAQELELASLEKRSFVPEMVKSVDEESL